VKAALKIEAPAPVTKHPVADRTRFNTADAARAFNHYTIPAGETFEDVLKPGYWARLARLMNLNDLVQVNSDKGDVCAILWVNAHDAASEFVSVKPMMMVTEEPPQLEAYSFAGNTGSWTGPITQWTVRRDEDGQILKRHIPSRSELIRRMHSEEFVARSV
jgi:hypothetical protein